MPEDLYGILQVPRDADAAAIKRAYRKRAKAAHPDQGGSVEKFGALKRAYDVLMDPDRRRHYDETGEVNEKQPDIRQAKMLELISGMLDEPLTDAAKGGSIDHFFFRDAVAGLKAKIGNYRRDVNLGEQNLKTVIAINERILKRFRRRASGDNLMDALITGRVAAGRAQLAVLESRREVATDALALLDDYEFEQDRPPERRAESPMESLLQAAVLRY